jgi:F-type H+-transporting ATPase subunit delta
VSVVHRTYARALYEAAQEAGRLDTVRAQLAEFVEAARDVSDLRELLRNPQLDPRAKAATVEAILGDADELLRNFLRLLVEKGRAGEIEPVADEFERMAAAEEGRLSVELTTAYELSDDEAGEILAQIERASGRKIEATRRVDAELIGGVVLQAGSLRLDASLRGRLERLGRELTPT